MRERKLPTLIGKANLNQASELASSVTSCRREAVAEQKECQKSKYAKEERKEKKVCRGSEFSERSSLSHDDPIDRVRHAKAS